MTPSLFPILSYNVEGGDPATLYDIARYQIKPIVSRVPGVGRVDVLGSDVREIEVVADPMRLAQQEMTFDDLSAAIRDATTVTAVGRMPRDYRQYLMVSATEAHSVEDIANIVVGHGLHVRDAVKAVRDAMLVGAALAVVVLLLFLRHSRITAVSASSIPLTLVITIFVMWLLGQTYNLMTLGAMAIAIGLVIDD